MRPSSMHSSSVTPPTSPATSAVRISTRHFAHTAKGSPQCFPEQPPTVVAGAVTPNETATTTTTTEAVGGGTAAAATTELLFDARVQQNDGQDNNSNTAVSDSLATT